MSLIRTAFFVQGTPAPQGSMRGFNAGGRVRITSSNKNTMPWRSTVNTVARDVIGDAVLMPREYAVRLYLEFVMPRRAAEPKTWTPEHTRKPDVDKLARAACDALTGVLFEDDSQVAHLTASKRTAKAGEQPGLHVSATGFLNKKPK